MDWDEGVDVAAKTAPHRQTERLEIYKKYTDKRCWQKARHITATAPMKNWKQNARLCLPKGKCRATWAKMPPFNAGTG